jgi:hypothetical protein
MTRVVLALCLAGLTAACSSAQEQTADPAKVAQLLASHESSADPLLSPAAETKLRKADQLAGTISKVEPKRIDPKIAVALLAR